MMKKKISNDLLNMSNLKEINNKNIFNDDNIDVISLPDIDTYDYSHNFVLNDDYCYRKIEIMRIYDGDTVIVNINLGMNITINNISIRLYGINTPEVKGVERENGLKSKDALIEYIKNRKIILYTLKNKLNENDKHDKYGRILGILVDKETGENYNLKLLENKYAKPYFIN
jgi:micrococcal nuclease